MLNVDLLTLSNASLLSILRKCFRVSSNVFLEGERLRIMFHSLELFVCLIIAKINNLRMV